MRILNQAQAEGFQGRNFQKEDVFEFRFFKEDKVSPEGQKRDTVVYAHNGKNVNIPVAELHRMKTTGEDSAALITFGEGKGDDVNVTFAKRFTVKELDQRKNADGSDAWVARAYEGYSSDMFRNLTDGGEAAKIMETLRENGLKPATELDGKIWSSKDLTVTAEL